MKLKLRVAPRAQRQIRAAARWWIRNRPSAPELFGDDLEVAYSRIKEYPFTGESVQHRRPNLRRVLLTHVQYHLYYSIEDDIVRVLVLWHTSRGRKPPL